MSKDQKLPEGAFYAQFHNSEQPHHHSVNHETKEWWEVHDDVPETITGKPVSYARGGTVKKDSQQKHPLHGIPGVHIITADAGEPIFTGER